MYADHLRTGTEQVDPVIVEALESLADVEELSSDYSTMSSLSPTQNVTIVVHNNLGWQVTRFIRIPCFSEHAEVVDLSSGKVLASDVLAAPQWSSSSPCKDYGTCGIPPVKSKLVAIEPKNIPSEVPGNKKSVFFTDLVIGLGIKIIEIKRGIL